MIGYDGWKLASPYDNDSEWDEKFSPTCEAELDYAPDGHECNDNCDGSNCYHSCGWNDEVVASCVGGRGSYTMYWQCGDCGTEYQEEVNDG